MRLRDVLFVVWVLALVMTIVLTPWYVWFAPMETDYQYDVKAQQAYDVSRVNDSEITHFEKLSPGEKEVLYEAFKKSDHFMGTSQVTVTTEEKFNTFQGWRSVEVNGVVMVIAIDQDKTRKVNWDIPWVSKVMKLYLGSVVYSVLGFFLIAGTPRY